MKRLLGAENVESDFKTAVFRFTDDTATLFGQPQAGAAADPRAQKLAKESDERMLKETGANLPARLAVSILNGEKPGFFFAQFDGGKRDRFMMILDHQNRIPLANFDINAGEKGLIWAYNQGIYSPEVWLAFYGLDDYQRGQVALLRHQRPDQHRELSHGRRPARLQQSFTRAVAHDCRGRSAGCTGHQL